MGVKPEGPKMTESQPVYLVNIENGEKVYCPNCHAEMGEIIIIDGVEFLKTSSSCVAKYFTGYCSHCWSEFHWSVSDRAFARLMKRIAK